MVKIKNSSRIQDFQLSDNSIDVGSSRFADSGRSIMVGLDEHLMEIKAQLCGESSKLHTIPIVGMGDIGKTTLARNVFDDSLIVYHFHIRAWVTISQKYCIREILLHLLDFVITSIAEVKEKKEDALAEILYKSLKGRRYLIVLDDIWSVKAWDDVKRMFPDDSNGSRIMLTTRLSDVAVCTNSLGLIKQMQFLNEDQSWNLLRDKVFLREHCPLELEEIGKKISRNCQGLPLAIVVIAGVLSKVNRTRYHWDKIARNVSLAAMENDERFSKILSLSYNHLPHHLKACFLYMRGFPEDYEIPVSKLVKLWVAEGFLKRMDSKGFEEVAEECLQDLVKRSLVFVSRKKANGRFKFCSIHDLLRDLSIRKAQDENFLDVIKRKADMNEEGVKNRRRLSIHAAFFGSLIGNADDTGSPYIRL